LTDAERDLKVRVRDAVDGSAEVIRSLSLEIYRSPELSGAEHRARAACLEVLESGGFTYASVDGVPTAFVAELEGGLAGPTVGLLAEYDALPGIGHGCGHHLIAGSTIGAAVAMASVRDQFPGTIRVYGCPAEETLEGKRAMRP
jgi:metal-dependent amidase/aminoacylase/carboxypeptidase family protein